MPPNTPSSQSQQPDYSFITAPSPVPKRQFPGTRSLLARVVLAVIVLIVLLIIFSIAKSLLSGPSNVPAFINVVQDQAEIQHLANAALTQTSISTSNKNFAQTTQLAIATDQSSTLTYLLSNGKKVNQKELVQKISPSIDSQLNSAAAASNFDDTFRQVMKDQLATYQHDLQRAYAQTKGPKGQALLKNNYGSATLLLVQLDSRYQ